VQSEAAAMVSLPHSDDLLRHAGRYAQREVGGDILAASRWRSGLTTGITGTRGSKEDNHGGLATLCRYSSHAAQSQGVWQ